jgi:hypothetical protein
MAKRGEAARPFDKQEARSMKERRGWMRVTTEAPFWRTEILLPESTLVVRLLSALSA